MISSFSLIDKKLGHNPSIPGIYRKCLKIDEGQKEQRAIKVALTQFLSRVPKRQAKGILAHSTY